MPFEGFILFAEDRPEEAELLRVACARAGLKEGEYHIVADGLEAVSYLERAVGPGVRVPACIVTDLRMPFMDGIELLQWTRRHPRFCAVPVMILTCTPTPEHLLRARNLSCDGFFLKPAHFEELVCFIREIVRSDISEPNLLNEPPAGPAARARSGLLPCSGANEFSPRNTP